MRERFLLTLIFLLMEEVSCLRSVISETQEKNEHFIQWTRAEILREAIETLEHKL